MYTYNGKVDRVIDGDTFVVTIDLGFKIEVTKTVRLYDIDVAEVSVQEGRAAKSFFKEVAEGKDVVVKTKRDRTGKYGRVLADIYLVQGAVLVDFKDILTKEHPEWIKKG